VLLHSGSGLKRWEDYGFRQDANFYYLVGMVNLRDAILALDGPRREITMFVRAMPSSPMLAESATLFSGLNQFALPIEGSSAELTGIAKIQNWNEFSAWLDARVKNDPELPLYLDDGGQVGGFAGNTSDPPDLLPIENAHLLWSRAIQARWPTAIIKPAHAALDEIRAVKSNYELALLRHVALITRAGIDAAIHALRPGRTHRQSEGEVIAAMMDAGADGPGFWPWVRSGTTAYLPGLFASFFDYHALDHVMADGELARINLGAEYGMYKGDYGRTFPVGARFTADQREVLDLFSDAYLSGLHAIRPGVSQSDVVNASIHFIEQHRSTLKSDLARAAADVLVTTAPWSMYGHGIDMVENVPTVFAAGNVLCWAPEFSVRGQGFYVEDMVLVTTAGYELLNPPLPYASSELEALKTR
jgi:Xaa-Pro aminopeptidase